MDSIINESLWEELENIEKIFNDNNDNNDSNVENVLPGRKSLSAYELAVAEGEKEELEDRLHELLSKTEEYDSKLLQLNHANIDLVSQNSRLALENSMLRLQLEEALCQQSSAARPSGQHTEKEYQEMEYRLAETRSKLARALQTFDDLSLAKDFAVKQLEQERLARVHVEKERDAYSAAYEASLTHFDKWSRSKQQQLHQKAPAVTK